MKKPDYTYGDKVQFNFQDKVLEGFVEIVDAYGTFDQSEKPSYDIMVEEENCLYKHVRESCIIKKLQ